MFKRLLRFWSEEHSLTALLVLLIVELFVLQPASGVGLAVGLISSLLFLLILLAGLLTMARHRVLQGVFAFLIATAIVMHMARNLFGVEGLVVWDQLFSLLSVIGMTIVVSWQVYQPGTVTAHRVRGAVAAYLLLAMLFAIAYALIARISPAAFNVPAWWPHADTERMEAFYYFSLVTLTTVGYGDITAIDPVARSLVMLEALIGQLYPAILLARLVSLQVQTGETKKR